MWTNFTTYFNRFYIAEKAFNDGLEEIELNSKKPLFQFKEEKLPSKANKNFDDVIKYSSKILQFNKDTKYVHEAIFMIAKAYYYKGLYNKALRKFEELDGLNDEEYDLVTKLWIAKSEMQMRKFNQALTHLEEVKQLAEAAEDEEVLFGVYVTEISYLIYKEEYSKAIAKIEELLKQDLDDDVLAEVTFELGMLYVSLENYEKAVAAFEQVEEGSPTFEIEFKSKLEYAKSVKHLGREEEALEVLEDLRDDTKYEKYWDLVDLEIAQINLETGETELALELFHSIDTGYTKNESSGIAAFMQGDIMEHVYMDFDSAKILYDRVATKKAPREYKTEAKLKSNMLKTRKEYSDKIFIAKKEYHYLLDTTLFVQDSIEYAGYLSRRDSAEQVANELKALEKGTVNTNRRTGGRRGTTRGTATARKKLFVYEEDSLFTYEPKLPLISIDSMRNYIARNEYELGNLYFTDLLVPDSAFYYYNEIVTEYPNTIFHPNALYALGSYYLTIDEKEKADSLFRIVYDSYRSNKIAVAAAIRLGLDTQELNADPAADEYLVAEELMEKDEYFDAIEKLQNIYEEYPESQIAPKALYAVGWIYENEFSDYDAAVEYYDSLKAKYPKTEYVRVVSPRLAFYHEEMKAIQDSIARVEKAFQDSIALANKSITDSLAATDTTAQFTITDSTLVTDSTAVVDTTAIHQTDTTKVLAPATQLKTEKDMIETEEPEAEKSDSAKAADLFKQAEQKKNSGKKK